MSNDGGIAELKGLQQLWNKLQNMWGMSRKAHQVKETDTRISASLIAELMQPRNTWTQKPQQIEAYLNLFYNEKVQPAIEGAEDIQENEVMAAVAGDGPKSGKLLPRLVTIMQKLCEMFKHESVKVKSKVEHHWKEMVVERELPEVDKKGGATKSMK